MDLTSADELLTTTRSVRKRLDLTRPVEPEVIERCIEIALQAPTGSNAQGWQFVVVTDADKRAKIAAFYQDVFERYNAAKRTATLAEGRGADYQAQQERVADSAVYLAENDKAHNPVPQEHPDHRRRFQEAPESIAELQD